MSYILVCALVGFLVFVPFDGIVPLDEKEISIIDNYKGFIDIELVNAEVKSDELLSDVGENSFGSTGDTSDVSNLNVLGDLSATKDINEDLKLDIKNYL